ncbi:SDR family NAD(P)-dependent oxidoreductase [Microbacterium sp.]|uniref:SDR family NAD(P)-dependent oxidoreductase n=1 Tax=Microbacterium sp. TaxID=51671 RepID=UPI0027329593|nr:glucose 1-dehydrogenase [Microbacterium sp.]MDP3950435.1 glucose 1-dehydrogenase [Microbacterium sp.]
MYESLENKVAIVTGGASGIGEACVRRFVAEGARVVIVDLNDDLGGALAAELGDAALYVHADVTSAEDWTHVIAATTERFATVDILVNNAGGGRGTGPIRRETEDAHHAILDLNVTSVWLGTRAALDSMEQSGGGSIVNISSIDGLAGVAGVTTYAASKFAVTGMTRTVALEAGEHNVRVNSVHPGFIETPMVAKGGAASHARLAQAMSWQPLPRYGKPDEVAAAVLFFASDESSFCTGTSLVVDGGHLAGPPRQKMQV